jgi:hypothetical protein
MGNLAYPWTAVLAVVVFLGQIAAGILLDINDAGIIGLLFLLAMASVAR